MKNIIEKLNQNKLMEKYSLEKFRRFNMGGIASFHLEDKSYAEIENYAWIKMNLPFPVGLKEPNSSGLYDMFGNIGELCKREKIHVIFVQQEFDQRNAQLIADELGIKVVSINPLSYDWAEEMENAARSLQ